MEALTTVYTPPAWCHNRYALYSAPPPWESTNVPSSGWVDPSFTQCIPSQYKTTYPTFSPGICPGPMTIVSSESNVSGGKTIWTGRCCQTGFTLPEIDPDYFCTSAVTAPIRLLVIPNITTADVWTTLPDVLSIQHDQVTVLWEQQDLSLFPAQVAGQYASMMGIPWTPAFTTEAAITSAQSTGSGIPPVTVPGITSSLPTSTSSAFNSSTSPSSPSSSSSSSRPSLSSSSQRTNTTTTSSSRRSPSVSLSTVTKSVFTETSVKVETAMPGPTTQPPRPSFSNPPSSAPRIKSYRLRNLCLAWTALFLATYLT